MLLPERQVLSSPVCPHGAEHAESAAASGMTETDSVATRRAPGNVAEEGGFQRGDAVYTVPPGLLRDVPQTCGNVDHVPQCGMPRA